MKKCTILLIGIAVLAGGIILWYQNSQKAALAVYTNAMYGYSLAYPKTLPLDVQDPKAVTFGAVSFEPGPGALFITVDEGEVLVSPAELQDQTGGSCQETLLARAKAIRCAGEEGFAGGSTTTYMVQVGTNLLSFYYIHGDEASNRQMEAIIQSLKIKN